MPSGSKPGERRGGRKKGTPNKVTAEVKAALVAGFVKLGGVKALVEWGKENRTDFYKIWVKLLPTEIKNADGQAWTVKVIDLTGKPDDDSSADTTESGVPV